MEENSFVEENGFTEKSRFAVKVLSPAEFQWMVQKSARLARVKAEGEKGFYIFGHMLQDLFYALFQKTFAFFSDQKLLPGAKFSKLVLQQLVKTEQFRRARNFSIGNMPGSGMFTLYFAENILRQLDETAVAAVNEIGLLEEELCYALLHEQAARQVASAALRGGLSHSAEGFLLEAEQWRYEAEEKSRQLNVLWARLRLLWNKSGLGKLRFGEDAEGEEERGPSAENDGAAKGTGKGTAKNYWARGDLEFRLRLAGQYMGAPKLERIARRLVQLNRAAPSEGKLTEKDILEIRGIKYGTEVSLAVSEDLAEFFRPSRRLHFFRRLAEESIFVYDTDVGRKKTKAALVLCLDNSGSMQGAKEITSKALALAMMEIAARQKRDVKVILFGGKEDQMKVFEFPKGRYTLDELAEVGESFLCSPGTDFEKPLAEAARLFCAQGCRGGDLVFITDGASKVCPEFLETFRACKTKSDFKTTSVLVGYGDAPTASLEEFSDRVLHSRELSAVDVAGELFGMLGGE